MLIGILGRAQNGKSMVADALVSRAYYEHLINADIYDIGDMVLQHCIKTSLLPNKCRHQLTANELQVLVDVGKSQRDKDPACWIKAIEFDYYEKKLANPNFIGVIPNVRYKNEIELVQKLNGRTIRVSLLNPDGSPFISRDRDPNHTSESGLLYEPADYYITTVIGQKELAKKSAALVLDTIIQEMKGSK